MAHRAMIETFNYRNTVIGELPEGWEKAKVDSELVDTLGGFSCARNQTVSTGIPHLRPFNVTTNGEVVITPDTLHIREDFKSDVTAYYLWPGDVLFNNTNSVELVGKTGIVQEFMPVAFSNHINRLRIRDNTRLDPRWLALVLRYLQNQGFFANHCRKWIGQAGFSLTELAQIDVPFPKLEIQQRILARIEALLAEVREMRKLQTNITNDTNRLLDATRHELFSQLANVPIRKFDEIAESRLGKMLSQSAKTGQYSKPYLRNANVLWDEFKLDDVLEMDFLPEEQEKHRLEVGDLLICEGGEIGRTAVWEGQIEECYYQKALHRARLRDNRSSPRYLMHFMAWAASNGEIAKLHTGSAIPHLTGVKLKTLNVLWPEPQKQLQIVAFLDSVKVEINEMARNNEDSELQLVELEQSVLAQAFRGDL